MALEQSILTGTKKKLNLGESDNSFDQDVIDGINTAFFHLKRLGIGPPEGFMIEDETLNWADFNTVDLNLTVLNALKTFVHLKVRLIFDPPGTSYHIKAIEDQLTELEHTLLTERDLVQWTAPSSSPSLP